MASCFKFDDPVLYFRPRSHTRFGEREFLLWPALLYRVIAPDPLRSELNVFERAVLGFFQAGLPAITVIAQKLQLHQDLVSYIVQDLLERGLLNKAGGLSADGLTLLQDFLAPLELRLGYVFQDPWTGNLWPRFVEHLEYAEVEYGDNGYPRLVMGTRGTPKRRPAYTHLPRIGFPSPPLPSEILKAVSRHCRAAKWPRAKGGYHEEEFEEFDLSAPDLDRVSMVDEEPHPVLLTTYLYLPEERNSRYSWFVCDPFGANDSVSLKIAIEREMDSTPLLRARVSRLLEKSCLLSYEGYVNWRADLREKARLNVEKQLTLTCRQFACYEHLVAMEGARLELGDGGPDAEPTLRGMMNACRLAMETVFDALQEQFPADDAIRPLFPGKKPIKAWRDRAIQYDAAVKRVGFEAKLPSRLRKMKAELVQDACRPRSGHLGPAVMGAVLAAALCDEHPMRTAAARDPGLLTKISEILEVAGGLIHGASVRDMKERCLQAVEWTYHTIRLLNGIEPIHTK